jgi:ABC-type proline/glycine betaine transport system substrate-binding protein
VRFIEQHVEPDPKAKKKRAQMLARALRKLGYKVTITPINLAIAETGMQI